MTHTFITVESSDISKQFAFHGNWRHDIYKATTWALKRVNFACTINEVVQRQQVRSPVTSWKTTPWSGRERRCDVELMNKLRKVTMVVGNFMRFSAATNIDNFFDEYFYRRAKPTHEYKLNVCYSKQDCS
jgi:hypothetical protein